MKRLSAILLLGALLAVPVALDRQPSSPSAAAEADVDTALERYGVRLQDVAAAAGIDFVHRAPRFDPKLDHIMPQVASTGAAVAVVDYDRDGWADLYFTNSGEGSLNRLYRNERDGTFRDVAGEVGLADVNQPGTGVSMGSVWGDYDNDGDEDVFLYKYGRPELFRNDAGRRFERVTDRANLPAWVNANAAVWFDFDRDGALDLFLAGYFDESLDLWHLETTRIMPESFEYAQNGGRKYLLRNRGDGSFEDVTAPMGIASRRWTLAVAAANLTGSGYPDLVLANDYGISELFVNRGGKRFDEVGRESGIGYAPKSGMNVSFGDIFNDGRLSIYETNISEEGILIQGNNLWVPRSTNTDYPVYENMANAMGVELGGWSWGAQFGDLNNDGHQDLVLGNGYVSADRLRSYWYDFSKVAAGHRWIISDAANWPAMNGRSLSGYQQKKVWLNDGAGRFTEVAAALGVTDTYDARAVAVADLWNRGVLDIVMANQAGPALVYRATVAPGRRWVAFELEGTASNRSAIGAEVRVFWDGRQQLQVLSGGSGFSAQNGRRLHFGLGDARAIEKVVITWPSGLVQTLDAAPLDTIHRLEEPTS